MRKLMLAVFLLVMASGVAFAAVTTGTFGDQNASKAYRMSVDSDGIIATATDTKVQFGSTAAPTASLQVGGAGVAITGSGMGATDAWFAADLQVDGVLYTKAAGLYVDSAIYGTTKGVSFRGVTTCGCKRFVDGICTEIGTCS